MYIEEYIKSKPQFETMPFVTVYATILELINDGYIDKKSFEKGYDSNVATSESEPSWQECRRLYGASYFIGNR